MTRGKQYFTLQAHVELLRNGKLIDKLQLVFDIISYAERLLGAFFCTDANVVVDIPVHDYVSRDGATFSASTVV